MKQLQELADTGGIQSSWDGAPTLGQALFVRLIEPALPTGRERGILRALAARADLRPRTKRAADRRRINTHLRIRPSRADCLQRPVSSASRIPVHQAVSS